IDIKPAGDTIPPEPGVVDPFDSKPFLFPILLDGKTYIAQNDSGASRSLISAKLAAELGKTTIPQEGRIRLAVGKEEVPRIGITSPIRIQLGPMDINYRCEIASELKGAQFLFGGDLITRVGLDHFRPIFRQPGQGNDNCDLRIYKPIQLIAPDFS